ncbi:hypothetical protein BD410DRAFT_724345 [Rickenella mellea]|uniref:Uncharacterized protein n=1 Tax=Rickenella mellea TaxID=50990 RepID=A0A4Y7Q2F2_9AGAM|nr:hypothetical protein BD410DRAFT_724345 [Rickenella mellea]
MWVGCTLCSCIRLAAGTLYIERNGWLLYRHSEDGEPVESWLRKRDATMPDLTIWSDSKQLTPTWTETPLKTVPVSLVDLKNNALIIADVLRVDGSNRTIEPNALVPLAVHGCGITCMILHRPDNPRDVAYRVGMVSMPPYVLVQGRKTGSVRIGAVPADAIALKDPSTTGDLSKSGDEVGTELKNQ